MGTFEEKASRLMFDEIEREYETPGQSLELFVEGYRNTKDTFLLLAAFCYQVATNVDESGNVSLPQWMSKPLAEGFAAYLEKMAEGPSISLEHALGITPVLKKEAQQRTSIKKMVEHVHIMRWLFGLGTGAAVHATYLKFSQSVVGKSNLKYYGITQTEKSFKDHYERDHAKLFDAWVTERHPSRLTEHHRQQILSQMKPDIARYVKTHSRPKTL